MEEHKARTRQRPEVGIHGLHVATIQRRQRQPSAPGGVEHAGRAESHVARNSQRPPGNQPESGRREHASLSLFQPYKIPSCCLSGHVIHDRRELRRQFGVVFKNDPEGCLGVHQATQGPPMTFGAPDLTGAQLPADPAPPVRTIADVRHASICSRDPYGFNTRVRELRLGPAASVGAAIQIDETAEVRLIAHAAGLPAHAGQKRQRGLRERAGIATLNAINVGLASRSLTPTSVPPSSTHMPSRD